MDLHASRRYLIRIGIVFGVIAVGVGAVLVLVPRGTEQLGLAPYLPENTIFSAEVPRQQLFGMEYSHLAQHPDMQQWVKIVQFFWTGLETTFSVQNDRVLWFITREADGLHQGIVFHTRGPVPPKNLSLYSRRTYPDLSWYGHDREQLHFFKLTPSIYALYHKELTHVSSSVLPVSDMLTLHVENEFIQWLGQQHMPTSTLAFTELLALHGSRTFYADLSEKKARFHFALSNNTSATSTRPVVNFMIPQNFDITIAGSIAEIMKANATSTIIGTEINSFINTLSNTYSIDPSVIMGSMTNMQGLVIVGSDWLIAYSDREAANALGSELTAWFRPRLRNSVLPDGSPYRELVKDRNNSTTEQMINNETILRWSHGTSTIAETEEDSLYAFSQDKVSYITNSSALVNEYTLRNAQPIFDDKGITRCISDLPTQALSTHGIVIVRNLAIPMMAIKQTVLIAHTKHQAGNFESVCLE